jgi:thiopeptide-type bacteriocin biosynthesis protein
MRYRLRATSRATPFGLFAGVAPVRFGPALTFDDIGVGHAAGRVDAAWLDGVIRRLEQCRELLPRLTVVLNNLAFVRDGRLVLRRGRPAVEAPRGTAVEVSIRLTPAVQTVLKSAAVSVLAGELFARLAAEFPAARHDAAGCLVGDLLDQGFLLSGLRPAATATDPLGQVIAALDAVDVGGVPAAARLRDQLHRVHRDVAVVGAARSITEWRARHRATASAMADASTTQRPVAVDLRSSCALTLPPAVAREVERAAELLARLAPRPSGDPVWRDYHARFVERFGVRGLVPLADLLYAETGLGFPAGYRDARLKPPPSPGLTPRDELLLGLAQTAAATGSREIVLDELLLADLAIDVGAVQPHTELRFQLHAASRTAVERGEFRLAIAGVSRAAGTTAGRFLDLFDDADRQRMLAAYRRLPTATDGALVAQLSGGALSTRAENVARAPRVLPHLIPLGEHHPHGDGLISIADLAVTGDAHRLWLVSLAHGLTVEPVAFHAVELTRSAHPLLRFLCEITTARATACAPFSWGAASRLPFLPRLRHGRTVLTPARWILRADTLPTAADFRAWTAALTVWRDRFGVPDIAFLGEDDRRLRLDLTEPAHLHLLRTDLDRAGQVTLREAPPPDSTGWCDGRVVEIVVPLAATRPPAPRPRLSPGRAVRIGDSHLPGAGEWLYAKLYAHPDRQTTILTRHLPELLARWPEPPQWWFLRYHDPDPHLRLRLRLPHPEAFGDAAARVGSWSRRLRQLGLLDTLQFDTYLPETGRFGAGAAMTAAETVFVADSAAAVAQLAATGRGGAHPHALLAASYLDLTAACLSSRADAAHWLVAHLPRTPGPTLNRHLLGEAIELADTDDPQSVRSLPGGDPILDAWIRRRDALAAYRLALATTDGTTPLDVLPGLLHLHQARVTGPDPEVETGCARLARAVALTLTRRSPATS